MSKQLMALIEEIKLEQAEIKLEQAALKLEQINQRTSTMTAIQQLSTIMERVLAKLRELNDEYEAPKPSNRSH